VLKGMHSASSYLGPTADTYYLIPLPDLIT